MAQIVTSLTGGDIPRARCAQVVARHGIQRVDIIVSDLMIRDVTTSSQSLVPALKLRAVILVLIFDALDGDRQ
jgi:hypothetical protein